MRALGSGLACGANVIKVHHRATPDWPKEATDGQCARISPDAHVAGTRAWNRLKTGCPAGSPWIAAAALRRMVGDDGNGLTNPVLQRLGKGLLVFVL